MENNEDKRMTVIAAEIERQEMNKHRAILACDDRKVDSIDEVISVLESLLEPEKEALIDFAAAYQKEVYYDAFDKSPRTYFDETYTQQTK